MSQKERATATLAELRAVIIDYLAQRPEGAGNSTMARDLGLETDFQGKQRNYLTWSVLGLLVNEGLVTYEKADNGRVRYRVNHSSQP